jgi:Cyclic nucleotide-binding domain.
MPNGKHPRQLGRREIEIERVYFPQSGMVSLVVVMQSDAAVETATIGRAGIIGASAGLGLKQSFARAIVQLPGTAAWLSASQFHAATNGSPAIRDLLVHYSGLLLGQVQQSVACSCECYVIVRGYTDKIFPPSEGA